MFQCIIFKHCQCEADTDAVIGSKRGALRGNPLTVNLCLDRVLQEIMHCFGSLLRHHVHVRLKDDTPSVLVSRSSRLSENYISRFISLDSDIVLLTPFKKKLLCFFLMLGRTWNLRKIVEVGPYAFRL